MSTFAELPTKKARVEFIREKVSTDPRWMLKGLLTIYQFQTEDEKREDTTKQNNGVGFGAFDAEILSSIARMAIQRGVKDALSRKTPIIATQYVTKGQADILQKRMKKYAGQLARIAETKCPIQKKTKAC